MRKKVTINRKEMNVEFSGYYDSALGDFLFTQVMCDVFMPGNEVVPIAAEKEQIKRVLEGFKKRKALYGEVRKEAVKGKSYYVITPTMRYDLEWLLGKKKVILSKDKPPVYVSEVADSPSEPFEVTGGSKAPEYADKRRKYLESEGFRLNEATNNWEIGSIRFPDALVGKPATDEEFVQGMARLLEADRKSVRGKKPQRS
ncbi:hypothetical protein GE107_21200 [Cohnella sp. CFH 77786]|uniref:hypothetical protein n=1 Tax=Cohnella sp. CFH 77786 TaxID=2662265 RepID=UPI001C60F61B|nr:hypothetical protein [Cohnella sp. CFH 77786]MBW5448568.1 hypothetical protein [Cohnella sp. CFH 77786]